MGPLLTATQDLTVVSYCGNEMILCWGRKIGFSSKKYDYLKVPNLIKIYIPGKTSTLMANQK